MLDLAQKISFYSLHRRSQQPFKCPFHYCKLFFNDRMNIEKYSRSDPNIKEMHVCKYNFVSCGLKHHVFALALISFVG